MTHTEHGLCVQTIDYHMVRACSYAEKRRALAKEIGLGTKGRDGCPRKKK